MTRRKVPSQAASGAETFNDNLVGVQITTGTGQLTNTNFSLDSSVIQRDNKDFKTNPFSNFLTLDDLKKETVGLSKDEIAKRKKEIKFKGSKSDAGKSLFGSLKYRLGVATTNIISKYPSGILVDSNSYNTVSDYTATNISYDNVNKTTQFDVEYGRFYNPFDIIMTKPKSQTVISSTNILRDFYSYYGKYVIDINNETFDIVSYTPPNSLNVITLKVTGKPFGTSTGYTEDILAIYLS